jgi:hypothetical protein
VTALFPLYPKNEIIYKYPTAKLPTSTLPSPLSIVPNLFTHSEKMFQTHKNILKIISEPSIIEGNKQKPPPQNS